MELKRGRVRFRDRRRALQTIGQIGRSAIHSNKATRTIKLKLIMVHGKSSPYRDNEVVVRLDYDWSYRDYDKPDEYDKLMAKSADNEERCCNL